MDLIPPLEKLNVLIVDDSATIRNIISKHLGEDYCTHHASNGQEAWQLLQDNNSISLVFADLHMPVMNGMVLLKQIRASDSEQIANLPVIMITGHEDSDAAKKASYTMGATDFVSKPFSALDISSRARSYAQLNRRIASLEQNVTIDVLTGLLNKRGFYDEGDKAVAGSHRYQLELSVVSMQLAGIEEVANNHGKKVADQIITAVAKNLEKSLRKEESLAHLGGGHFAVLLPMTKAFRANIVAVRFQDTVSKLAFQMDNEIIKMQLAAGINSTVGYNGHVKFNELHMQADKALLLSLEQRACQVVSHDETFTDKPHAVDNHESSMAVSSQDGVVNQNTQKKHREKSATSLQQLSPADFSRYMSAILDGDFDTIPEEFIEHMVEPLQAFLNHACGNDATELLTAS